MYFSLVHALESGLDNKAHKLVATLNGILNIFFCQNNLIELIDFSRFNYSLLTCIRCSVYSVVQWRIYDVFTFIWEVNLRWDVFKIIFGGIMC